MADETIYRTKLYETEDISAPDELVQGEVKPIIAEINSPGEYKRGMLLAETSDGSFIPAAANSTGLLAVCAESKELPDGMTAEVAVYLTGSLKADSIILPYETESDDHDALISAAKIKLRAQGIYLS